MTWKRWPRSPFSTARKRSSAQRKPPQGLLEAPASGNLDPGQRQQWLQEAVTELDALQPALTALAERRADLAEEDHRRVREASLRSGESLRMRFRCEPSLPVDVIGLFVLLPAPTL